MALQLGKKIWIRLDNIRSIGINKKVLTGDFQFDSFESEHDNKTCYVTKRFGNGMHYMIPSEMAEKSIMIPQPR